jgi:predicted RNA-binding Zn-ribbon protein involved in translation (DUF1610 family)
MSELANAPVRAATDVRKFPCKQCGAQLTFAPGQTVLKCPYCGYTEEIPLTAEAIREHDLDSALVSLPKTEGWGTERRALHCENCGAVTTFAEGQVAGQCAFCGSSKVVEEASSTNLIRPESLVPFAIGREQAVALFRTWISSLWFRPNNLKTAGQLAKIAGAYLPFWTFDAYTSAHWTAEAGYYYYETEYYTETDSEGHSVQKSRQVQRTRWEFCSGFRQDFFDDELVCASRGLPPNLIQGICPYELSGLVPYEASFLAGFTAEEYKVDLEEGWSMGKQRIEQKVYSLCSGDVPGDTQRGLSVNTAFSQMTFKHTLLPVWVAAYLYNDKTYRFLVNGQTGKATGEAPLSWWKIVGLVLLILAILGIIYLVMRSRQSGHSAEAGFWISHLRLLAQMAGLWTG